MVKEMKAYRKLNTEITRMTRLERATIAAYEAASEALDGSVRMGELDRERPVVQQLVNATTAKPEEIIASNYFELRRKYERNFRDQFRAVLFVRLMSALEVFLIDNLKGIYRRNLDLFAKDKQLEKFPYDRLLTFDSIEELFSTLVDQELRRLQTAGFEKIVKHYRSHLQLNFNWSTVPLAKIIRMYEERHLLVHRLGTTDKQYRHNYNVDVHTIVISQEDWKESVEVIQQFATFIAQETEQFFPSLQLSDLPRQVVAQAGFQSSSPAVVASTRDDFSLSYLGEEHILKDILVSKTELEENTVILHLKGPKVLVDKYIAHLKNLKNDGLINNLHSYHRSKWDPSTDPLISHEKILELEPELPTYPWKKGYVSDFAKEHSLERRQAWFTLDFIKGWRSPEKELATLAKSIAVIASENRVLWIMMKCSVSFAYASGLYRKMEDLELIQTENPR